MFYTAHVHSGANMGGACVSTCYRKFTMNFSKGNYSKQNVFIKEGKVIINWRLGYGTEYFWCKQYAEADD